MKEFTVLEDNPQEHPGYDKTIFELVLDEGELMPGDKIGILGAPLDLSFLIVQRNPIDEGNGRFRYTFSMHPKISDNQFLNPQFTKKGAKFRFVGSSNYSEKGDDWGIERVKKFL